MIDPSLVFLDCETLPTVDADLIADIESEVTPPGNISKPESIAAWHETKGAEARKEAVRRTSLDGGTGHLGALAWAWFERQFGTPPTLCGHNIAQFDIRWIWKRAIVIGVTPPWWWPVAAKPWDADRVQDTMVLWEGPKGRISQDRLARMLGLKGKGDVDGSMVADLWEQGRHEEIRVYCADDVATVRRIWCRITGEDAPAEEAEDEVAPAPVIEIEPAPVASAVLKDGQGRVIPAFLRDLIEEREAA